MSAGELPSRRACATDGFALVIVRATGAGEITVKAESEGLEATETVVTAR